jgi:hypothetical protein
MGNKSFANRLAELEQLEAEAEAEREAKREPFTDVDAELLDDDEVLDIALAALDGGLFRFNRYVADWSQANRISSYAFLPSDSPRYWGRIAERADVIRKARNLELIPATDAGIAEILAYLRAGDLRIEISDVHIPPTPFVYVGPPPWNGSHKISEELQEASDRLNRIIDALIAQRGLPRYACRSTEQAIAWLEEIQASA